MTQTCSNCGYIGTTPHECRVSLSTLYVEGREIVQDLRSAPLKEGVVWYKHWIKNESLDIDSYLAEIFANHGLKYE